MKLEELKNKIHQTLMHRSINLTTESCSKPKGYKTKRYSESIQDYFAKRDSLNGS